MARTKHCPKCDADISDTYEGADPDTGIMVGGWWCDTCNEGVADEDADDDYEPADFSFRDEQPF
jgi:hypothetical protein